VIGRVGEHKDLLFKVAHSCFFHGLNRSKSARKRAMFVFQQRIKFARQGITRTAVLPMHLKELSLYFKELSMRLKFTLLAIKFPFY